MSDSTQKSYLRDGYRPRAVDSSSRRHKDGDEGKASSRSKHSSSRRPPRSETSHRGKSSSASANVPERPSFELDVVTQPQRSIAFGSTVDLSIIASLRVSSPEMVSAYRNIDTSRLMAVVALVSDSRSGERMAMECGTLTGQTVFDSIHEVPEQVAESLARSQPCRLTLGYFQFTSLLIRQPGTYRVRVTLIKMGSSGSGGSSIAAVDSDQVKVERRSSATTSGNPRKHQR